MDINHAHNKSGLQLGFFLQLDIQLSQKKNSLLDENIFFHLKINLFFFYHLMKISY